MPETHMAGLDLNLLTALDALLAARSVSAAARRVGMTQPSMSRALGRLRLHFADALLVRTGRGMVPTPRAERLALPLRAALEALARAVAPPEPFSPAASTRTWRVATADYVVAVVVPTLMDRLAASAPGMNVAAVPLTGTAAAELASGALDAVLCPQRELGAGIVWSRVVRDDFVCVCRAGHPAARQGLTLDALCAVPHVFVAPAGQATGIVDEALARLGRARRIAVRIPSFLAAPAVAARTGFLAVVPRRVAQALADPLGLVQLELPLTLPALTVSAGWHERSRKDPAHQWLRRQLSAIAATP